MPKTKGRKIPSSAGRRQQDGLNAQQKKSPGGVRKDAVLPVSRVPIVIAIVVAIASFAMVAFRLQLLKSPWLDSLASAMLLNRIVAERMVLDRRPPFEVTELPGRGKGLVATHQIKQGQLIMTEKPLFILPNAISSSPTKLLNDVTSQLTPFEHAQYFNLSYPSHVVSSPDEVALSIFMTNAIAAGEDEAGIFPVTARLNHGCSRAFNVVYHWREEKHELVVHALRDIEPGEELLTTYTDTKKPRAVRREYLSQHYHFQCNCAVCSLPDNESQKSDDRLVRYAENRLALSSWASGRIGGVDAIRLVKEIWSIGQEEGYLSERGQLALDAAYVCAAHTDVEAFKAWIRLAIKWTAIELGRDDEKVAGLKALSDRPESHPEWNTRPHLILPLLQ